MVDNAVVQIDGGLAAVVQIFMYRVPAGVDQSADLNLVANLQGTDLFFGKWCFKKHDPAS